MYILYGGKFTRTLMVEMVLAEIGADYELRDVDIVGKQHLSEEFLKINPAGWVPALITPEGDNLYETQAINLYLAERHSQANLAPLIGDPQRGPFLSAFFYLADELEPALKRYFYPHRYADGEADAPIVKSRAYVACRHCLGIINDRLAASGPYHLGDRFSLADIVLTYWARTFEEPDALEYVSHVKQCVDKVGSRPKLKPVFDKQAAWMAEYFKLVPTGGAPR